MVLAADQGTWAGIRTTKVSVCVAQGDALVLFFFLFFVSGFALFCFISNVFLYSCSSGCLGTSYVYKAGLEFTETHLPLPLEC